MSFVVSPVFHSQLPVSVVPSGSCGLNVTTVPAGNGSVDSTLKVFFNPPKSLCATVIPLYSMTGVISVGTDSGAAMPSRVFISTE